MKGKIVEVFDSIQGEGLFLGEKQLFIRFFGCNLNCRYCDTKLNCFTEYDPEELISELRLYKDDYHSLAFTGGEPLLQKDFLREIARLAAQENTKNYLETNGTLPDELEEVLDYFDIIAMDFKLPSSTGLKDFWSAHRRFLKVASRKDVFIKAVICQSTEKKDLQDAINLIKETNSSVILVLQPNSLEDNAGMRKKLEQFKEMCLQQQVTTCIIPQMHKVAWLR